MNIFTSPQNEPEQLLQDLADALQVPPSRYKAAERSYNAVGNWLLREDSSLKDADPKVYVQGSFRLGTAIKPFADHEDYDIDLVCELSQSKSKTSQETLKNLLGKEISAYATARNMQPPSEGRRCWTLTYADGAQFHLDTLPAIPDGAKQKMLLENRGHSALWAGTAIAITDTDHPNFTKINEDWPHSNPIGFCNWFHAQMTVIFEEARRKVASKMQKNVEDIPDYEVRTPLQSAIQILKHHRDRMFEKRGDVKPISIILTTLAAKSYCQESTILGALTSILSGMANYIEYRNGVAWIENPTDPNENFADRWARHPERAAAFYEWLIKAQADFDIAASSKLPRKFATNMLTEPLGKELIEAANKIYEKRSSNNLSALIREGLAAAKQVLSPRHKQAAPWSEQINGAVKIEEATMSCSGFRPEEFNSGCSPLPKQASLRFEATTTVPKPYKVYWQVVNTGHEAERVNGLRGGFIEEVITSGKLTRIENTLYSGTHSIECFIVKNGYLVAKSGQFIVNIQ